MENDLINHINSFAFDIAYFREANALEVDAINSENQVVGAIELRQSLMSVGTDSVELTIEFKPFDKALAEFELTFDPGKMREKQSVVRQVMAAISDSEAA